MATEKETRELEIIVKGQQANASLKEMGAAAAIMNNQLAKMAADDPKRQELINQLQELRGRIKDTNEEIRGTTKSQEELRQEQEQLVASQERAIQAGQRQGASLRDMSEAAKLMQQRLATLSTDDPGRAAMIRDYQVLQKRIQETSAEINTYVQTEEERRAAMERANAEQKEVILNGQKVDATFTQMKASAAALEQQLHNLSANDPARAQLLKDYQEMQKRLEAVKKEMQPEKESGGGFLAEAAAIAGFTVGLDQAVDLVKELGAEVIKTVGEFGNLRSNINTLTGAQGEELDQLTVGVASLAKTYHKEYDEILVASNTLSKQMGISQAEALELIKKGFQAGADVNGEFLDQVKEYPTQFKAAGLSASQFIGVISQSATTGVFSDKGADVIKEFGLRIREQTKSTSDAMEAAFGTEFTQKLFKGINDGSISTAQALQMVSQQMNDTKIPASQLQTVIADVFGGPGEDAGLDYIKSLKNVGAGVDGLIDKTNAYTQRQDALYASNQTLAESQNALAKQFEGAGASIDTVTNYALSLLYTLLASLATVFGELAQPVQEFWHALGQIAEQLGLTSKEGITMKDVGNALVAVFRGVLLPTRGLYEAISWLARAIADWSERSTAVRITLLALTAPLRMLKDSVVLFFDVLKNGPAYFDGFSAAADVAFTKVGRGIKAALTGDFVGAKAQFTSLGADSARAFQDAFNAALASKAAAEAKAPTVADPEDGKAPAGGDGTTQAQREKAAEAARKAREKAAKEAKAAQDKADQERLDAIKALWKDELDLREAHNALRDGLDRSSWTDQQRLREQERKKIFDEATAHVDKLTGLEWDYTERVAAIVEERDLRLRELQDKYNEEDEQRRQEAIDKQIEQDQADAEAKLAQLDLDLANGVTNEWAYQDAVYAVKLASFDRELALLKAKSGVESVEYKKMYADRLKLQADYNDKTRGLQVGLLQAERTVQIAKKVVGNDEVNALGEVFGKKSAVYKAALAAQKALAVAEIGIGLFKQYAANAEAGAKIAAFAPPVTTPLGPIYTFAANAAATVTAGMATAKILGFSFARGGRTGSGLQASGEANPVAMMMQSNGLRVAPNGKLVDDSGFAVAGLVHQDEYVIPKWMRQDPEVAQVEEWLEARRLRGYVQGGSTTDGDSLATSAAGAALSEPDVVQLLRENRDVLRTLNQRLVDVETWRRQLQVLQQDNRELLDDLDYVKQVRNQNRVG